MRYPSSRLFSLMLAGGCAVASAPTSTFAADEARSPKRGVNQTGDEGAIAYGSPVTACDGAQITPNNHVPNDRFGAAVAIQGGTMVVGGPGRDFQIDDNRGGVLFFDRINGVWTKTTEAFGGWVGSGLGASAALDGDYAITGAPHEHPAGVDSGSAIPWHRTPQSTWQSETSLTAWDGAAGDGFGTSVAMGENWAAAASPFKAIGNQVLAGKVYVYRRFGPSWGWHQDFTIATPHAGDALGTCLAMRGNMLAAGATGAEVGAQQDAGKVLVAEALLISGNPFAANWTTSVIAANDAAAGDHFGASVAFSDQFLYVGAPDASTANYQHIGAVYVFKRLGASTYQQVAKITMLNVHAYGNAHFGRSIAVDGSDILVSDANGQVFRYCQPNPNVSVIPTLQSRRVKPIGGTNSYGQSMAISNGLVAFGAPTCSFSPAGYEGAVYAYGIVDNDSCVAATAINHGLFSGCTLFATVDGSASCNGQYDSADVWFKLDGTAGNVGPWSLRLNSNYDSVISAHIGGCPAGAINQIACDDDSAGNFDAKLNLNVTLGQSYLIRVAGFSSDAGAFQLVARKNDCPADITPSPLGDRAVNVSDLLSVITSWGACPDMYVCPADIVGDTHAVDVNDLLAVITAWGACPN